MLQSVKARGFGFGLRAWARVGRTASLQVVDRAARDRIILELVEHAGLVETSGELGVDAATSLTDETRAMLLRAGWSQQADGTWQARGFSAAWLPSEEVAAIEAVGVRLVKPEDAALRAAAAPSSTGRIGPGSAEEACPPEAAVAKRPGRGSSGMTPSPDRDVASSELEVKKPVGGGHDVPTAAPRGPEPASKPAPAAASGGAGASERQIALMKNLAAQLGEALPVEAMSSVPAASAWISAAKKRVDLEAKGRTQPATA